MRLVSDGRQKPIAIGVEDYTKLPFIIIAVTSTLLTVTTSHIKTVFIMHIGVITADNTEAIRLNHSMSFSNCFILLSAQKLTPKQDQMG